MSKVNWGDKCWVATIFLVNKENKVLLTWNKNLKTWIPVGGHIDEAETPQEAVRREVEEETGFEFELYGDFAMQDKGGVQLVKFHRFQIEKVSHHGVHMNFVFFGKCTKHNKAVNKTDEKEKLRWFSREEIVNEKGMLESVRSSALAALNTIRF